MAAIRSKSLRSQLSLTYAGIALLTAVLLGGILLSVLERLLRAGGVGLPAGSCDADTQTSPCPTTSRSWRRGLRGPRCSPRSESASAIARAPSWPTPARRATLNWARWTCACPAATVTRGRLPEPLGDGLFGGPESASRSDATLKVGLSNADGEPVGYLLLSEPPTSGRAVLIGIAQAWTVAALARRRRWPR